MRTRLAVTVGAAVLLATSLTVPAAHAVPTAITVTPVGVDFGDTPVGTTTPAVAVQVTNTGGTAFGPVNIFGGAPPTAEFNAGQNCQGKTLPAGGSCQISYTFSPSAPGEFTDLSSFTISPTASQSDGEDFTVTLAGCGGVCTPPDVERQVTLRLRGSLTAKGRVRTSVDAPPCTDGVTVLVQRRRKGAWRTVDTTLTNAQGRFRESLSRRPGKYRAMVQALPLVSGATCLSDVSRVRRP